MTINNRQDYVILDLIQQAVRNVRAMPVNLGGISGGGGGEGTPPGGFIGLLAQTKVAYDTTEASYLGILSTPSGTLVDNLAHIRYRLDALEAGSGGGGSPLTVDEWDGSPSVSNVTRITFSGAIVTDLGGGHILVNITTSGGGAVGSGDSTYLRLDATNDPVTGQVQIITTAAGEGAIYGQTIGDASTADFEQYTNNDNVTSPTLFLYRESDGSGTMNAPMLEMAQSQSGTGNVRGDYISLEDASFNPLFKVDYLGKAYDNNIYLAPDFYGIFHRLSGSSPDDDEFSVDSSGSWSQVLPTGNANWTWGVNHCLTVESWSIASNDIGCVLTDLTGWADGHWIETCIRTLGNDNYNYAGVGLVLTDGISDTSNAVCALLWRGTTSGQLNGRIDYGTITNINGSTGNSGLDFGAGAGAIRLKLKRNSSTSYDWYAGTENGAIYFNWGQANYNPGFTPTHGGLFVENFGTGNRFIASFDYFRHMS